jgi:hypothetical protein
MLDFASYQASQSDFRVDMEEVQKSLAKQIKAECLLAVSMKQAMMA